MLSNLSTNLPRHLSLKFIKAYIDSGDLVRAGNLFDKIPKPDLRTCAVIITAYTRCGLPKEAIKVYDGLRALNISPNKLVLLSVAKACATLADPAKAREVHKDAIQLGFHSDLLLGNALIHMYGKCKSLEGAKRAFDDLSSKDVVSWTSIVSCYVTCGLSRDALVAFREMWLNGVRPNSVSVLSVLPACSDLQNLDLGREIHGFAVKMGIGDNVCFGSALVHMYASCLRIRQAQFVFDNMSRRDVVSWNVILSAYFLNKECEKAFNLFMQMKEERVKLNHASWNAVIGGCVQNGLTEKAVEVLGEMQCSGLRPNQITIISLLSAFTNLESLRGGKEVHSYLFRHCFIDDLTTMTALVFMYSKCGELELSTRVFNMMPQRDTIAWNTMIIANSMHGKGNEALSLFHTMLDSGVRPNSVTFTGVLSGCSHSCLVDEGLQIFESMTMVYAVEPDADHYSCMVDVLSRAGHLEKAYDFIQKMPTAATASSWGALLGGCRVYKNVRLGQIAAERLFEIEPDNPGNYVLMSNIFDAAKLWGEASETRKLMRDRGITKMPGCSWIEVNNRIYTFVVGDPNNYPSYEVCKFLDAMVEKMRISGYKPDTDFALQDVDQEEKVEGLCAHSEKLAVAFGLLNLKGKSSIRVFKNLRICGDCHNAIKFMAKISGVQIIVRDSLRFHHFKDNLCSCQDFW